LNNAKNSPTKNARNHRLSRLIVRKLSKKMCIARDMYWKQQPFARAN
jgi:hypothetical protein